MIQHDLFSSAAPLAIATLREIGDTGKQRGMELAADANPEAVEAGQVALLRALMAADEGTATIDDATPTAGTGGVAHSNSTSTTTAQGHQSNETI